jgi:hypothetical protein
MHRRARLAIGAVALIAGVAIFWLSVSMWTRDRLHDPATLRNACIRERDVTTFDHDSSRGRAWLARVVIEASMQREIGIRRIAAYVLVEHFGFLLVPVEEQHRLIAGMRRCASNS